MFSLDTTFGTCSYNYVVGIYVVTEFNAQATDPQSADN